MTLWHSYVIVIKRPGLHSVRIAMSVAHSVQQAIYAAYADEQSTDSDGARTYSVAMQYTSTPEGTLGEAATCTSSPSPDANSAQGGSGANHYPSAGATPRLPPILQVEKVTVTTSATQLASASRRRNEANFVCPVPGCGSTFTRRFNLRGTFLWLRFGSLIVEIGHLRSHTEERPYICDWPGCNKGFARQHDCK